jgi:HEAT repeat protein
MNMKYFTTLVLSAVLWLPSHAAAVERSVAELLRALKSTDTAERIRAISELGSHRERAASAVAPLAELLKDKSAAVRAHAAQALGEIGAPAKTVIPALAELLKDAEPAVRRQAVQALVAIRPGPQVAVPIFVKLLEAADPAIKVRVLQAMADAGPAAVPGLIEALKNEKAAHWACLVLRELGPAAKDAAPTLVSMLRTARPEMRREIILTLAAMDSAAAAATPQIAASLDDEHTAVAATYALARIGRMPAEAEVKIRNNSRSKDTMLATVSMWALAKIHPEDKRLHAQAAELLIARLKDEDPFVRVAAARALAALPPAPEIMVPLWEKTLKDADETTVHHALDALAALGAPVVPRLLIGLQNEKLRPHILQVLRQIGPAAAPATGALAGLIDDADEHTARSAILALAAIGPGARDAVGALVKALEQKERPDTFAVIYALGRIGPAAAAAKAPLSAILADPKNEAAVVAAWAVVKIDPTAAATAKAVPVLSAGLTSPHAVIRRGAAEALGELGRAASGAVSALERAAKDEDASVREAAAGALAAIRR